MTVPHPRTTRIAGATAVAVIAAFLGASCTPLEPRVAVRPTVGEQGGIYHTVRKGETLWRISKAYRVSVAEIKEVNGLADDRIGVGERLLIPGALAIQEIEPRESTDRPASGQAEDLAWPLAGRSASSVSSPFGERPNPVTAGREFHRGIDIPAPEEERVLAAAGGEVVHAGRMSGFGNVVMINHGGRIITVYAHLSRAVVELEGVVVRGQIIGYVGDSGRTTGSHLHFEVRWKGVPVDPLEHLP